MTLITLITLITLFSMLLHNFSLDGQSQLRTMADGLHGSFTHAMYSIRDERMGVLIINRFN